MISVFGSKFTHEEIEEVGKTLTSQWVGIGKKVAEFEETIRQSKKCAHFAMVDSASNGLYLALELLNLPKGAEVILPTFTWVSCAQAVLLAGLKPVFCDVELDTQNISIDTIRPHLSPRTAAIMVVHYAGKPVDMDPILALGIPVIEDAAHAINSSYKGKACGTIGTIGVYSFDSMKNVAIGEGGGLVLHDSAMFDRAKRLRYCGIGFSGFQQMMQQKVKKRWWEYEISEVFIKMLPTDLEAAIGLVQLKKQEAYQQHRKELWDFYQEAFQSAEWIKRPVEAAADEQHGYFTYFIQVEKRDELALYLLDKEIYTTLRYHPLHLNPIYESTASLKNAEQLNETGLNIPLHPGLRMDQAKYIAKTILDFAKTTEADGHRSGGHA